MKRLSSLLWMLVIVVAAFMLYSVKYRVQALHAEVASTERELNAERESLHVVAAEWAYLNRPERIRQLAAEYLDSDSVTADQVAEIEAIPFPVVIEAETETETAIRPASYQKSAGR